MRWPDFFPDDCPPEDARAAAGVVYRLVRNNPPKRRDFRSYRETQPKRQFNSPECIVCGLSVFTDIEDIDRLHKRYPGTRNRLTAKGTLNPSLGKMIHTPYNEPSHHTWWVPVDAQPWTEFSVV